MIALYDGERGLTELLEVRNALVELTSELGPFGELVLRRGLGQLGFVVQDLFPQGSLLGRGT